MTLTRGDALLVGDLGTVSWPPLRRPRLPDLAVLIAAMAVLIPFIPQVHWLTGFGAEWAHRLGVPIVTELTAFVAWPELLFWLTSIGAVGLWLARPQPIAGDPWLGAALGLVAVSRFVHGPLVDPDVVLAFAFGAFLFAAVRSAPPAARATACRALAAAGLLEASLVIQQASGVDLSALILYAPAGLKPLGTFGNPGLVGGFIAVTMLLGPAWMLPIAALSLWLTHSAAALCAFGAGLAVRYRPRWSLVLAGVVLIGLAAGAQAARAAQHPAGVTGALLRAQVWALAAHDHCTGGWLIGCGLGNWARRIPDLQATTGVGFDTSTQHTVNLDCCYWTTAHNDPLQWVYETGAAGLAALVGWLIVHRRMFIHAVCGGAVFALAIFAVTWDPFHRFALALPALVVLGCATAPFTSEVS